MKVTEKLLRARRGVWGHPNHAWFTSIAHTLEDIDKTTRALHDSLREFKKAA